LGGLRAAFFCAPVTVIPSTVVIPAKAGIQNAAANIVRRKNLDSSLRWNDGVAGMVLCRQ
jgi:hypothetical protein